VKPVRQLDQYDPDIVRHGKDHLSDALSLTRLRTAAKGERAQLGHPGDNVRDFLAEHLIYLFRSRMSIFDHIMQEAGRNADNIEFHVSENAGHFKGMRQVRFTGQAHLSLVDFGRVDIGTIYDIQITILIVLGDLVNYVVYTDHLFGRKKPGPLGHACPALRGSDKFGSARRKGAKV